MRNAEEHKKLLEQIAALERDSVNYFDVEKEFFLIDSDNLSQVQTRFYGYSIQADGIYEEDNLTEAAIAGLDGRGCYVYVEVKDGQITIKQDLNGCWGIYLFRHGDYFALSNSFFRLLDHVKFKYPLTVNRDYCNYLLLNDLCAESYSDTAVNEIELIERNAIVYIDITKKNLQFEWINYKEHTCFLDSPEGMATLDSWVEFWGKIFRGVAQNTEFITADLSGGFDSRVSFALLLNSGLDLNKIRIYSIKDDLHTHKEDYDIASQIANHYGFVLNKPLPRRQFLNLSFCDAFNRDLYVNRTFSSIPKIRSQRNVNRLYHLSGADGEGIRHHWQMTPKEFIKKISLKANAYSYDLEHELTASIKNLVEFGLHSVCNKHQIQNTESVDIPQLFRYETRSRFHFGKDLICDYLMNIVQLCPAIDYEVRTLQLYTPECPDPNLLIALLFTRYEPDLLKFPFDSNHSIAPETIAYAQKINERFPRSEEKGKYSENEGGGYFHLQPRDTYAEKILASGHNNPNVPYDLIEACLKAIFESSRTYGLFTAYFDEEFYRYAANYYETKIFGRFRPMYVIYGITKVLEDVEISQHNYPLYRDVKRFLEKDFCQIPGVKNSYESIIRSYESIIRRFAPYTTARIDVKLVTNTGDFQIVSVSDNKATIATPVWLQKGGVGYVIHSHVGKLKIIAKADVDGKMSLHLRGLDIRDPKDKSKRIPYWIDYTKLSVNGEVIFDKLTPTWHDVLYRHNIEVKANEEITIEVEWLPHRSDT